MNHRSDQAGELVEYALMLPSGGMQVLSTDPKFESLYPLAQRVEHWQDDGMQVYRRRVIVVSDWEEVPPVDTPRQGG